MSDYESIAMDAAYDDYMESLYREHRQMAIEEFTTERLQSYYIDNPGVAEPPQRMLSDARALLDVNASASLVFSASASELGVKVLLVRPMVFGLVHAESSAGFVAELVITHTGMDRFRPLLFEIMSKHAAIDLANYRRVGSAATLWNEMCTLQARRNVILHRGEVADRAESERGIQVATTLLDELFPALVGKLGLHTHERGRVCLDLHEPSY